MSHLSNPLATAQQLFSKTAEGSLPPELQDSIFYSSGKLTQAAGVLLRLPQAIAAQAVVILYRFLLVSDLMQYEFSDTSAAAMYLTAKISASPRSLRSVTNVYAYLTSPSYEAESPTSSPESYYLSETSYITFRNRLLNIEGQILNAINFNTHVSLPHPLAITYLQTLDLFSASQPAGLGTEVARRAVEYLNSALLSPQLLYLTHQPNTLATAAIYLAAREVGAKLPDLEWWEVFDTDREELGFLAVAMRSLEGWARTERELWGGKKVLKRGDVREVIGRRGNGVGGGEDEEGEMMRLLDEKIG